jgi:hypothetical protein
LEDEAMTFVFAAGEVKSRQLAYREPVSPCTELMDLGFPPLIFAGALLFIVGFPAVMLRFGGATPDTVHAIAEKLMSDVFLPFAKTNFHMMSSRKRRSLE